MSDLGIEVVAYRRDGSPIVALPPEAAASAVGLSRDSLDKARGLGLIEYHRFGTKRLVLVDDLAPFVRALPVD